MNDVELQLWARIFPFLDQAHDIPTHELESWLAGIAAQDPDIEPPLRALLTQRFRDGPEADFLEIPFKFPPAPPPLLGQRVGAYAIDSLLGRGGMGEVWLAHRSDGRFEGLFAVKFLEAISPAAVSLDRFIREGRLLARLAHPNIARLIDAGVMPGGRPYLVLEYVKGEHIDQFCASHSLDLQARVGLFLNVLAAVAHAHSNLIVHRDIKPSNVLVTSTGEVKLLDFGVAKLLAADFADTKEAAATRTEDAALTPAYAAPEQILGEPPSTATDVYQLGVLLHVLLVGRLPFAALGSTRAEHIRAALDETPARLSDHSSGPARKVLRGDLDAILAKALRKRPTERYTTAAALAADLQRYLDHEPVLAREGALAYRAGKFARRYRGAVIATGVAALALMLATAFSLLQMREAQRQRDRAQFNEKSAEAESQFLALIMSTVSADGRPVTPAQILTKGLDLLDRQYANDPQFRALMLIRMSARFIDLRDAEKAFAVLVKAETIARQMGDQARLAEIECDAVESQVEMGQVDAAAARLALGRDALARAANPGIKDSARCMDADAAVIAAQGDAPRAIDELERALALMDADGAIRDPLYTEVLSHAGYYYNETGNLPKAFEFAQREVASLEGSGLGESQNAVTAHHNLATMLTKFGEIVPAAAEQEITVARARGSTADGLIMSAFSNMYGALQLRLDRPAAALQAFDASLVVDRRNGDAFDEVFTHNARASALIALGRLDEAGRELATVEQLTRGKETVNRRALARASVISANLLLAEGKLDAAAQRIDATLQTLLATANSGPYDVGLATLMAARIALADRRYADCAKLSRNALAIFEKLARQPDSSADVGESLLLLAKAQRGLGDAPAVAASARRAQVSLTAGLGPGHPLTIEAAAFN